MQTRLLIRAALLTATTVLLPACGDVLDSPEDNLPPPVDLGSPSPSPAPAPSPAPPPAPGPTIPTKADLAGTWLLIRENGVAPPADELTTLTFYTDGTYIQGGNPNDASCNPTPATAGSFANYDGNGNGIEFAEYSYNETSGHLVAGMAFIDSNGNCGLHETTAGATQDTTTLSLNGGVLKAVSPDGLFTYELERVSRGSGVAGSWVIASEQEGSGPIEPSSPIVVFTALADGRYILLSAEAQGTAANGNPESDPGMSAGRYSIDAANNFTLVQEFIETSNAGFSGDANKKMFVDSSGMLHYSATDGFGNHTVKLLSLPLAPRFNASQLVGQYFNDGSSAAPDNSIADETEPSLIGLFADGKFILGSFESDAECFNDYAGTGIATEPNGNGYEVGSYAFDVTTGRLKVDITTDTTGSCGAKDVSHPETLLYIGAQTANTFRVISKDSDEDDLDSDIHVRVPSSANSLFGSWRGTANSAGTTPDDFLVAYFDDSTAGDGSGYFFAVDANPGSTCSLTDSGPRGGVAFGTFIGRIDYTASAATQPGTLCQTRFDPSGMQTLSFTPDFRAYTDNQASTPAASFTYQKITTP
ncbi:MAG: hypothetical protein Q7J29_11545 [Stagnimonas sp.]|nr:hypothetical protein [Stagnimonas sp.]